MVLHKDLGGADHAAVAWRGPGLKQQVLTGQHLALPVMDQGTRNLVAKAQASEKALDVFLGLAPTALEGFVANLSPADHKALAARLNQKLASARKGKEPELTSKLAKLGAKLIPSPENVIADAVLKAVLAYEDAYLKTLVLPTIEALGPHRSAAAFGVIPPSAKPVRETVQISSRPGKQAREWVSTGLYVLPGKKVAVTLPDAWVGKELILRIGHHNPASSKNALDCMPDPGPHRRTRFTPTCCGMSPWTIPARRGVPTSRICRFPRASCIWWR